MIRAVGVRGRRPSRVLDHARQRAPGPHPRHVRRPPARRVSDERTERRPGIRLGRRPGSGPGGHERTNHCLPVKYLAVTTPAGRCAAGEEALGTWGDDRLFGFFGEMRGSLACTVETDGHARIDWTTVDTPIWATLWRDDEDIAAAYGTWSEGRLNPVREPR
jgi:hypothetical protein